MDPEGDMEENFKWILSTANSFKWSDLQLRKGIIYQYSLNCDK